MTATSNTAVRPVTIALIAIDETSRAAFHECFRQFDIEMIALPSAASVDAQKFEGCVVSLDSPSATEILESIRQSARNCRVVIYGLFSDPKIAATHSRYGINVLLPCPIDRASVAKAVRSTRLLLLNELRRYVRIPLAIQVTVDHPQGRFSTSSVEVSGGGMSLAVPQKFRPQKSDSIRVQFTLPGTSEISASALICWYNQEEVSIGIRFDPTEKEKEIVRMWVDEYLRLHEQAYRASTSTLRI